MTDDQHGSGLVVWLTGLPGSGKTTLASAAQQALSEARQHVVVLDGDKFRRGVSADLGFTAQDRAENIRRAGEVAALCAKAGLVVLAAFISPNRADREQVRRRIGRGFHEIYINADLRTCEGRDPKGLYRLARSGAISEFTGVSAPYDIPEKPDLLIDTMHNSIDDCTEMLVAYITRTLGKS